MGTGKSEWFKKNIEKLTLTSAFVVDWVSLVEKEAKGDIQIDDWGIWQDYHVLGERKLEQ